MKKAILLLAIAVYAVGSMAQTTVKMKTGKAAGEDFTFTVSDGIGCLIDWGDGKIDTVFSTAEPITGKLAGETVTLKAMGLTYLDCSGQELSQVSFTAATDLETAILSDNNLTALNTLSLTGLKTLWIDNNQLSALNLSKTTNIESVVASNNQITSINVGTTKLAEVIDFWVDGNKLSSLSLNGSTRIQTLNIEGNTISKLTLSALESQALAVFMDGNSLDFTSLWNKANVKKWYGTTQNSINFAETSYKIGETFSPSRELFGTNQDETELAASTFTFNWYPYTNGTKGTKLTKGTAGSTTADYTVANTTDQKNVFTFNKAYDDVQLEVMCNKYLGFLLTSDHISIIDPDATGIIEASAANNLSCTTGKGEMTLQADEPTEVTVYSISGTLMWKGQVQGAMRLQLGKGIYLVNNVKVAIR
jgi:hypothetical protein